MALASLVRRSQISSTKLSCWSAESRPISSLICANPMSASGFNVPSFARPSTTYAATPNPNDVRRTDTWQRSGQRDVDQRGTADPQGRTIRSLVQRSVEREARRPPSTPPTGSPAAPPSRRTHRPRRSSRMRRSTTPRWPSRDLDGSATSADRPPLGPRRPTCWFTRAAGRLVRPPPTAAPPAGCPPPTATPKTTSSETSTPR
jgi:hypothetical protein